MSPRRPPRSLLGLARKIDYLHKTLTGRSSAARHLSTLRAFLAACFLCSQNRLSPPAEPSPGDISPLCGPSSPPASYLENRLSPPADALPGDTSLFFRPSPAGSFLFLHTCIFFHKSTGGPAGAPALQRPAPTYRRRPSCNKFAPLCGRGPALTLCV